MPFNLERMGFPLDSIWFPIAAYLVPQAFFSIVAEFRHYDELPGGKGGI